MSWRASSTGRVIVNGNDSMKTNEAQVDQILPKNSSVLVMGIEFLLKEQ